MSSHRDYYRILHVQPDAPTAIIHASYRTLMQRLKAHPDLGGDHEHAALLNEAHAVLSDPDRRAAYDLQRDIDDAARAAKRSEPHTTTVIDDTAQYLAALRCLFCGAPHGLERAINADDECGHCASPLFASERHRLEYSGQRMLSRVPKLVAVSLYTRWPQPDAFAAEMHDLSLNGMQLKASLSLQIDQVVKIDCAIFRALARVAHCHRDPHAPGRWIAGLEFMTLRFANKRGSFVSARA